MRSFERLDQKTMYEAGVVALAGLTAYLAYSRSVWKSRSKKAEQENKLDPKTGLLTFPAFSDEVIKRTSLSHRAQDIGRTHGLILVDIDDFGRLNKVLTHPVTDREALLPVAEKLKEAVRPDTDLVGRFGGEEFSMFLSDVDPNKIDEVSQRIQKTINEIRPDPNSSESVRVTIAHTTFEQGGSFEDSFQQLSEKLNQAKEVPGKNQIVSLNS